MLQPFLWCLIWHFSLDYYKEYWKNKVVCRPIVCSLLWNNHCSLTGYLADCWLCVLSSRWLQPMTSQREETTKSLFEPASPFVYWSPTTNEGTLSGVWWRRGVGREATCPPTTSQSCQWDLGHPAHSGPTARRGGRRDCSLHSMTGFHQFCLFEGLQHDCWNKAPPASQTVACIYKVTISVKISVFKQTLEPWNTVVWWPQC